jgi:hypothetical protein
VGDCTGGEGVDCAGDETGVSMGEYIGVVDVDVDVVAEAGVVAQADVVARGARLPRTSAVVDGGGASS